MAQIPPFDLIANHLNRNIRFDNPQSNQGGGSPSPDFDSDLWLRALRRQCNFVSQPFTVGVEPLLIRTREDRTYLMIVNTSGAAAIYLGFDFQPTSLNGVILTAGGAYEPYQVPTNDIWIAASIAGATGTIIYAVGN